MVAVVWVWVWEVDVWAEEGWEWVWAVDAGWAVWAGWEVEGGGMEVGGEDVKVGLSEDHWVIGEIYPIGGNGQVLDR